MNQSIRNTELRIKNAEFIKSHYFGTQLQFPESVDGQATYWQLLAYVNGNADAYIQSLRKYGVDAGRVLLPVCSDLSGHSEPSAVVDKARKLKSSAIIIPAYAGLNDAGLRKIVRALNAAG